MSKIEEQHLVESHPERGRTDNVLLDSDVEIKTNLLALPTPPSSRRRVVANFASTDELAGAQKENINTKNDVIGRPTPKPLTTPAHAWEWHGAAGGDVILESTV